MAGKRRPCLGGGAGSQEGFTEQRWQWVLKQELGWDMQK